MYRHRTSSVIDVSIPKRKNGRQTSSETLGHHPAPHIVSEPVQQPVVEQSIRDQAGRLDCAVGPFVWTAIGGQYFVFFDLTRKTQTQRVRLVWKELKGHPVPFSPSVQNIPSDTAINKRAIEIEAGSFEEALHTFNIVFATSEYLPLH